MANIKSTLEIAPYREVDIQNQLLVDRNGQYQSFLKIRTVDLKTMNFQNLSSWMEQLALMCRVYVPAFKILSLTNAAETTEQQLFWQRQFERNTKKLQRVTTPKEKAELLQQNRLIKENIHRVQWVEQELNELAFYLVIYGETVEEIIKNRNDMIGFGGRQFSLKVLNGKELEKIAFRLQNMMSEY